MIDYLKVYEKFKDVKEDIAVAFSSILFVNGMISEIPYKITSKCNPNVSEGVLKVSVAEEKK